MTSLETLGLILPTPAYLIGTLLFGIIGFAVYRHGKRAERPPAKWIGMALMLYPMVVSDTAMLYAIGTSLCGSLYWFRNSHSDT